MHNTYVASQRQLGQYSGNFCIYNAFVFSGISPKAYTLLGAFNVLYIAIAFLFLLITVATVQIGELKKEKKFYMYYYDKNGAVSEARVDTANYVQSGDFVKIIQSDHSSKLIPKSQILQYEEIIEDTK